MIPKSLLTLGLFAVAIFPTYAAEPDADALLRQMSAKLAAAKSLRFEATREISTSLLQGPFIPQKAKICVAVERPNKLAGKAVGKAGVRRFIANGKTLTVVDEKNNFYATVPMRKSIDGLVDELDQKFGFVPPLADFAVSDPYRELRSQAKTIQYLGTGKVTKCLFGFCGTECHRIFLKGKSADAELWIGVEDQLPRKFVVTFRMEGAPKLSVEFSNWDLAASINPSEFAFTPSKGAWQIEMWTNDKMQSLR